MIVDYFIDVNKVGIGLAVFVIEDDPSGWDSTKVFRNFGLGGNFGDSGVFGVFVPKREAKNDYHGKAENREKISFRGGRGSLGLKK